MKYRENGIIRDEYIGKDPEIVNRIREQLNQRKHYEKMLSELKREQKMIAKIMEGVK